MSEDPIIYNSPDPASGNDENRQLVAYFASKEQQAHALADAAGVYHTSSAVLGAIHDPHQAHALSCVAYPKVPFALIKNGLALSNLDYQQIMGHSWASIRTRNNDDLVGIEHSERLVFNALVLIKGREIFGNDAALNRWLRKFNPYLNSVPLALLKSTPGAQLLLDELERIYEGHLA